MTRNGILILFLFLFLNGKSQQLADTLHYILPGVEVISVSEQERLRTVSSESNINSNDLQNHQGNSLVSAINTAAGVRMEERSPGSYRLSIRGSLLRSPFGIRNVKIYLNGFPFTDAGGNTYLNSLDAENISSIKILKGPESSLFGANTGGALLINSVTSTPDSLPMNASFSIGSYGMTHEHITFQKRWKKYQLSIGQGIQTADGYRSQSAMQRQNIHIVQNWAYSEKAQIKAFILFSDLHYETPGGLTLSQFKMNPRSARLPTARFPGAVEQKAGVYNKTNFVGITHNAFVYKNLRHIISVFGSHTDFQNPFITNYEIRKENTYGLRTYFDLGSDASQKIVYNWNAGIEWQQTAAVISNYGNKQGFKDTMQTSDDVNARQYFFFARFLTDIHKRFLIEASASINFFGYRYKNNYPVDETMFSQKKFQPHLMPRLAMSYKITEKFAWRISMSRGYSPPTIAEIRPSDNIIYTDLQAEKGWNYETGIRWNQRNNKLWLDVTAFYFYLNNTIVRRVNSNDAEYFINAGETKQPGAETQLGAWIIEARQNGFIRACSFKGSLTYSDFRFENYSVPGNGVSGNKLTGVPNWTSVESINIQFPFNISFYLQHYYSSTIPLNDANTEFAKEYHIVQLKGQWQKAYKDWVFSFSSGIDNLFDERYSLGNDLNAAGGRYYNPAPNRNYYATIGISF